MRQRKIAPNEIKKLRRAEIFFTSQARALQTLDFSDHPAETLMNAACAGFLLIVDFHNILRLPQNVVATWPNELLTHLAVVDTSYSSCVEPDDFHHKPSLSLQFSLFRLCGQKGGVPLMATKKAPAKKAAPAKAAPAKKAAPKKKAAAAKAPAKKAAPKKK